MCLKDMATLSELAAERAPIVFDVQRSDLTIQINFGKHFWPLFHNIPSFYSALLDRLGEFGVVPNSIRTDVADGSLGAYNVNFWMFNFRASVRIRLERLELQFNNILQSDLDELERVFVRLTEALAASFEGFEVASYAVDLGLHGQPLGVEPKTYLARFISNVPEGVGPHFGSGVVFYFGEEGQAPLRTITADLSGPLPGKVYVRLYSVLTGTTAHALRGAIEEHMTIGLRSLGLTTKAG